MTGLVGLDFEENGGRFVKLTGGRFVKLVSLDWMKHEGRLEMPHPLCNCKLIEWSFGQMPRGIAAEQRQKIIASLFGSCRSPLM